MIEHYIIYLVFNTPRCKHRYVYVQSACMPVVCIYTRPSAVPFTTQYIHAPRHTVAVHRTIYLVVIISFDPSFNSVQKFKTRPALLIVASNIDSSNIISLESTLNIYWHHVPNIVRKHFTTCSCLTSELLFHRLQHIGHHYTVSTILVTSQLNLTDIEYRMWR